MHCSRNFLAIAAWMVVGPLMVSAGASSASTSETAGKPAEGAARSGTAVADAERPDEKAKKTRDPKKDKDKSRAEAPAGKTEAKAKGADSKSNKPARITLPTSMGHDSLGLRFPVRNSEGKLQMNFVITVANQFDANHVRMTDTEVETFNDSGQSEMTIQLPSSVLELNTRIIRADKGATIKRSDFEISGQTMEFNTQTKQGKLVGNVRMLIYNIDDDTAKEVPPSE